MKRAEDAPARKTCYEIPSTMNTKTAGYLIFYAGFLIFCGVLDVYHFTTTKKV